MKLQKVIARNVLTLRKDMSRQKLAELAGVNYQTVYEIEKGLKNPSIDSLTKIAEALNVPASSLLSSDPVEKIKVEYKLSEFAEMLSRIPDDIFKLAQQLDVNDEAWDIAKIPLEVAIEKHQLNAAKKKKA
jgi:transcriptional regulator with XRE-family HTH domain